MNWVNRIAFYHVTGWTEQQVTSFMRSIPYCLCFEGHPCE